MLLVKVNVLKISVSVRSDFVGMMKVSIVMINVSMLCNMNVY